MASKTANKTANTEAATNGVAVLDTPSQAQAQAPVVQVDKELADKRKAQEELEQVAEQEADSFIKDVSAVIAKGSALKSKAREHLARKLGSTANKYGRPAELQWFALMLSMSGKTLSYDQRADIARKAIATCPDGHKPAAKVKSGAMAQAGKQTFVFALPAQIELANG